MGNEHVGEKFRYNVNLLLADYTTRYYTYITHTVL